jgi:RNA-directed DNA polymerase
VNLLSQVASYANLHRAFRVCARGKRRSPGYQKFLSRYSDELVSISKELLSERFTWSPYRTFTVHDPKARIISAPEFRDRVVHTAICRLIEPFIEAKLSKSVFACRKGYGNRNAVIELCASLKKYGEQRFVIKLDVAKYFDSIDHELLLTKIGQILPDDSLVRLLRNLICSYHSEAGAGKGLPIGALTSQLFANFYLAGADTVVEHVLGQGLYVRYMDDLVLCSPSRACVWDAANQVREFMKDHLLLSIPFHKVVPLGCDPVPFLGFVVNHDGYQILARNRRRHTKKIKRMFSKEARESEVEQVRLSFAAWQNLEPHLGIRMQR